MSLVAAATPIEAKLAMQVKQKRIKSPRERAALGHVHFRKEASFAATALLDVAFVHTYFGPVKSRSEILQQFI